MELPRWVETGRSATQIVLHQPSVLRWTLAGVGVAVLCLPLVGWPVLGLTGNEVGASLVGACITAGFAFLVLSFLLGERCLLCLQEGAIIRERRLGSLTRLATLARRGDIAALSISCCSVERERGAPLLFYGIDLVCANGRVFTLRPARHRDLGRVRGWVDAMAAATGIPHRKT